MDVRTMCLGVLSQAEATGYALKKLFEEGPMSHFLEASFGSIYPALDRLAREGLVTCRTPAPGGRQGRKLYQITEAGRRAFAEALAAKPEPDRFRSEFLFQMLFVDQMSEAQVRRLIDLQIERMRAEAAAVERDMGTGDDGPGVHFVRAYGLTMCDTALRFLESHRASLEASARREPAARAVEPSAVAAE